jgi:dipeptidase E
LLKSIKKSYIGVSAGPAVMQKNINLIDKYTPEMNDETKLNDLTGMSLTNIEILPHYTRYLSKFDRIEEIAAEYEIENDCKIPRIDDGQGVFLGEAAYELI